MSDDPAVDREQLATVLEQIAEHSSADDIRAHLRLVTAALRGNGLVIMNGPPQQKMREYEEEYRERVRLYGVCPAHQTPLDVHLSPDGRSRSFRCPACDEGVPFLLA